MGYFYRGNIGESRVVNVVSSICRRGGMFDVWDRRIFIKVIYFGLNIQARLSLSTHAAIQDHRVLQLYKTRPDLADETVLQLIWAPDGLRQLQEIQDHIDFYRVAVLDGLSEAFVEEFLPCFQNTCLFVAQQFTPQFLEKLARKWPQFINWVHVAKHQALATVVHHLNHLDWLAVSENPRLSEAFIRQHQNQISWPQLYTHVYDACSDQFVVDFQDRLAVADTLPPRRLFFLQAQLHNRHPFTATAWRNAVRSGSFIYIEIARTTVFLEDWLVLRLTLYDASGRKWM